MASKHELKDEEEEEGGLISPLFSLVRTTILRPFNLVTSKPAQRVYLTTLLATLTSLLLLATSILAYTLFYHAYIPRLGFTRPIHLQFDNVYHPTDARHDLAGNPYGTATLAPDLVAAQRYDILLELRLPRTPENRDAGNFMVEATLHAAGSAIDPLKDSVAPGAAAADNTLASSRRAAMVRYRSRAVEAASTLAQLHWYLLGWREEDEALTVALFEGVEFARGWRALPATMRVQIQSSHRMQVYSARATFRARLGGLRWLMYNHRVFSAVVFVIGFWVTEMVFAALAWGALTFLSEGPQPKRAKIEGQDKDGVKQEESEERAPALSETERQFPTSSQQQPLLYTSPPIKREEDEEAEMLPEAPSQGIDADDEEEEEDVDVFLDSGIGTSMETSAGRRKDSMRRRRGRTTSRE